MPNRNMITAKNKYNFVSMNGNELKRIISQGEKTRLQLKLFVDDAYKIATEMVSFSNSFGGMIIIGVDAKSG